MYRNLAASLYKRNLVFSRLTNLQIRLVTGLLVVILLSIIGIRAADDASYTFNQYIPVNDQGIPITAIRGDVQHLSDDEITDWVTQCSQKSLSMSPSLYQKHFMEFASKCLPPSKISEWGQTLKSSGYLGLVQNGAILEFRPNNVNLIQKRVIDGRLFWRYSIKGILINAGKKKTLRTNIGMDVVVARQDPFNYEKAIAITRIVL